MTTDARNHHYIPQSYLKGFSNGGSKKSKIKVFDIKTRKTFETIARNIAAERDFNRVEISGIEPNMIESFMSGFEGKIPTAVSKIENGQLFEGESKAVILNLMAFLAIRTPQMRTHLGKFFSEIAEYTMASVVATEDRWNASISKIKEKDNQASRISYQDMKAFVESKQYTIKARREFHIGLEFSAINTLFDLFQQRNWTLVISGQDKNDFICTNHPLVLSWDNPDEIPAFYRSSPGFGMKNTTVQFPLSRKALLLGTFEDAQPLSLADQNTVAGLNTRAMYSCESQIYAPNGNFPFWSKNQEIKNGNMLFSVYGQA
jgi:hypothetical protein